MATTLGSAGEIVTQPTPPADSRLMVGVRIRPLLTKNDERCVRATSKKCLHFDEGNRTKPKKYFYDNVFDEHTSQDEVYQTTTAHLVKDVLEGFNAAVFAYGATGSGKTHTMLGHNPKKAATPSAPDVPPSTSAGGDGLMVKAIADIYKHIEQADKPEAFKVSISYLEIYNELIRDLLNPGYPLELREDNKGNQLVSGLSEKTAISKYEMIGLILKGNKARTVEPTEANQTSSRSHALLSITVMHATPLGTRQGRLFLTDLAGSERAKRTKNKGKRLQEGAHINRSLLALGNCINALAAGARYVNYRDSKLTRLLKEALSGRCKTVMIAHVSPESNYRDETKNTLVYADRANHITTRMQAPSLLEEAQEFPMAHYQSLVSELKEEVNRLKTKLQTEPRPRSGVAAHQAGNVDQQKRKMELKNIREQIVQTFKQQMKLRRRLLEADSHLLGLELDSERQQMVISHWQGKQGKLYDKQNFEDEENEGNSALRTAYGELQAIEKETRRYREIREATETDLEDCRQRGIALEDAYVEKELPERISSDEERELLALLCRVHELEADKVSLQAERLARQAELRRRDLQLLRAERQRRLCEDIISTQRKLIQDKEIELPEELREMYDMYQQEIHASVYNPRATTSYRDLYLSKLPPIYKGVTDSESSSSSSEWSPSPLPSAATLHDTDTSVSTPDRFMGAPVVPSTRLPPIRRIQTSHKPNSPSTEEE